MYPRDGTLAADDTTAVDERNLTVVEPEGRLTQREIERFLQDLTWEQNDWRYVADREADYYDSKQLDAEILQLMEDRGMPPLVRNVIGPTIDGILGMEAQSRRDLKVVGVDDTEEAGLTADALNVKFNEAQRVGEFDRACGDAYKGQVTVGIGWMGVSRPLDPFEGQYRCESLHRRSMFWDFRARRPDLSDARYMIRKEWFDKDILKVIFPDKAEVIEQAANMWAQWDWEAATGGSPYHTAPLSTAYSQFTSTALEAFEWLDTDRERVALYEVWYKVPTPIQVMRLPERRVVEFDPKNRLHQGAVQRGAVLENTITKKVRLAYWLGPHQIMDIPTPYPHNQYPYIPFFGMREDRTGIPYGLIRRMMSPQDEVNARLSKMMWLLSAKRIEGDSDAFDMDHEELLEEAGRSDALILFDPNRQNPGDKPVIKTDHTLAKEQFQVMQDAEIFVQQKAAGTFAAFQGQDNEAQSGKAFERLIEQSATSLSDINDNYTYSRKQAGEQLLSLVKQDVLEGETVTVERKGKRMTVVLNNIGYNEETGLPYRSNHVAQIQTRVELEEVPKTAAYRQQQYDQLAEIIKSLPEQAQMAVLDLLFKVSDLPDRQEIIDRLNKMGVGESPDAENDPEVQARKKMQQRIEQLEMRERETQIEEREAKTAATQASIDKIMAEVQESQADTKKTKTEVKEILAKIEKIAAEIGVMQVDTATRVEDNRRQDEREAREADGQRFDQEQRKKEAQQSAST